MVVLSLLIFIFWLIGGTDFIRGVVFKIPCLRKQSDVSISPPVPKVSILFAARNEGSRIAPALKSMLSQNYPNFEVIAINDRSADDTLQEMQKFSDSPNLKILNIADLPSGWLGKNHALERGAEVAANAWLLFTDADVIFEPQTLRSAIAYCEENKKEHLALFPKVVMKNILEMLFSVCFGIGFFLYFRPWEVTNPKSKAHIGIGAFNLVKREAYQKIGGHKSFALNVLDDMELGRQVKAAGFRSAVAFGHELLSVRWVEGWQGIVKGLEKNGFAGVHYSLRFLSISTVLSVLLNVMPFIWIFFTQGMAHAFSVASVVLIFFVFLAVQRFHPQTLLVFPLYPLGCILVFSMIWRSAWIALREGGIRWRDTFYKLETLK